MRGWRVSRGGNQKEIKMNEKTLKWRKEIGVGGTHRQIAVAEVGISRDRRI